MSDTLTRLRDWYDDLSNDGDNLFLAADIQKAIDEIERLRGSLQKIHRLLESEFGGFYLSALPAEALGKIRLIMMGFDTERLAGEEQADDSEPGGEG